MHEWSRRGALDDRARPLACHEVHTKAHARDAPYDAATIDVVSRDCAAIKVRASDAHDARVEPTDGEPEADVEAAWASEIKRRAREALANPDDDSRESRSASSCTRPRGGHARIGWRAAQPP
jgi:hypothetical protein